MNYGNIKLDRNFLINANELVDITTTAHGKAIVYPTAIEKALWDELYADGNKQGDANLNVLLVSFLKRANSATNEAEVTFNSPFKNATLLIKAKIDLDQDFNPNLIFYKL